MLEANLNSTVPLVPGKTRAPECQVVVPPYAWYASRSVDGRIEIWRAGRVAALDELTRAIAEDRIEDLSALLLSERESFGLIVRTDRCVVAVCDRIQAYPLLWERTDDGLVISADARIWRRPERVDAFDEAAADVFLLSGYTIGKRTLLSGVSRLLPGEFLFFDRLTGETRTDRYYRYSPSFAGSGSEKGWRKRLGEAIDAAITRTVARADGRTIWLSLSAGLDSRVILGKLLEHGYPHIRTFSYGTSGNMEAREASAISEAVGTPWRFIAPAPKLDRQSFWHGEAADYMRWASGLHTTVAMTEFMALEKLAAEGVRGDEAVIVNGQTGDYLTGGHLRDGADLAAHQRLLWDKHFSLFSSARAGWTETRIIDLFSRWLDDFPIEGSPEDPETAYRFNLSLEWQERQCNYVVNQQRACDFLGQLWSMPLWDADLMDVYSEVPLALQMKQTLYRDYLVEWNFRGLFDVVRKPYVPWPRGQWLFLSVGGFAGLLFGEEAKKRLYKRLYYFTDHWYQYQLFGFAAYQALGEDLRNPASMFALLCLLHLKRDLGVEGRSELERRFEQKLPRASRDA